MYKFSLFSRFEMSYNEAYQNLWSGGVRISPHYWYHQCTRLNTVTGLVCSKNVVKTKKLKKGPKHPKRNESLIYRGKQDESTDTYLISLMPYNPYT